MVLSFCKVCIFLKMVINWRFDLKNFISGELNND